MSFRKVLFPISIIYSLVLRLRHKLFDLKIFKSYDFEVPIICVGNLSLGGTGKSPMTEYLVRLLANRYQLAILSRGYRRKTRGFVLADASANADTIGDEPYQYKRKFSDIEVAVDSRRERGISHLSQAQVVILDDAMQHRAVSADLTILLSTYDKPFFQDFLLPAGDLRDIKSRYKTADIIIITKCPRDISESKKLFFRRKIGLLQRQKLFFSHITYGESLLSDKKEMPLLELQNTPFTLVTGIANAHPMVTFLKSKNFKFEHLKYGDHHSFTKKELVKISSRELIITTEKDYSRLEGKVSKLYYLPIEMVFNEGNAKFDSLILDFMRNKKTEPK